MGPQDRRAPPGQTSRAAWLWRESEPPWAYTKSSLPVMAAGASGVYFMGCVCTFQPGLAQDPQVHTNLYDTYTRWQSGPKKQPSYERREPSPHYKEEQKIPLCDGRTESPERTVSLRLPQCHVSVSEPS